MGSVKHERKYCSKACMDAFRSVRKICPTCGVEFKHFRAVRRTYCSQDCGPTAKSDLRRNCLYCSKEFKYLPKDSKTAKYCCFSCKVKYEGDKRRKPAEKAANRTGATVWREIREAILERDGYACKRCAATDDLVVHHIVAWKKSMDNRPENLITVCRSCHAIIEPRPPFASLLART
jgi:5-methylcytosine-specific restriction endonuclease McrA